MTATLSLLARAGALAAALLAVAAAAPASAQTTSDIPPPVRYLTDENGIDVARGEHLLNVTDVSIGPEDASGLAYTRQLRRNGGGNPYDMGLFQNGSIWTATVGLASYAFSRSGTIFTSTDGSGATLVETAGPVRTLTLPDGTIVVYDYNVIADDDVDRRARAGHISYPTGERLDFHWLSVQWCTTGEIDACSGEMLTAVRLQAVENSLRYQLHFTYARAVIGISGGQAAYDDWKRLVRVSAVNTVAQACDPLINDCLLPAGWPVASYSADTVTDPENRTTRYTTDAATFRIRRPGSASDDVIYTYGADGNIDSVVRDGLTWTYNYSVSGNVATMTVTLPGTPARTRTIVSDLDVGLPTSVTNEVGQTTSYQYDSAGRLSRAIAPAGNYLQYTYDARGNVTQTQAVAKPASGTATLTTSAVYPAGCANVLTCNQPTSTTDARGNTTNYTYSSTHGGLLTVTLPAPSTGAVRPQTRYAYAGFVAPGGGTVQRLTAISQCQTLASCNGTADEAETLAEYNQANLLVSEITRRNGTGTLAAEILQEYDWIGNVIRIDGPLAGTADSSRTRYNLAREVTGTVSPDPDGAGALEPRAQRITRSATTGLVTRVENGTVNSQAEADWATFAMLERVDLVYDTAQRLVRRTLMGSDLVARAQTQISYDDEGRPQCTAARMNPAEFGTSTNACAPDTAHATYGADRITRTTYDAANRVTLVQTGYGVTAVQANEAATAYTNSGRVLHVTDAEGNRTTYEYDGHDRLVRTRFPSPITDGASSSTDDEVVTLDANGNVVSRMLRDGTSIAYSYDALNRLMTKNPPGTGELTVTYGYDNLSRMTSAATSAQTLTFTYDALGRNLSQAGPHGTTAYQYDLAGRRTVLDYPGSGLVVNYDYLVTGEVTKIRENGATSGVGVLATFGYDQLGRRTSLARGNGASTSYSYDPVSRLSQLVQNLPATTHDLTLGFSYNPAGQITTNTRSNDIYSFTGHSNASRAYTNDGLNRVTSSGSTAIAYDDNRGNITDIGTTAYTYNSENMLVSGGGITLAYDPLMRLYQASTSRWAYDGAEMIAEYDTSNALRRRFVHGPGVDEPLVWYEGTGTADRRWLHADERGSIIAISDGAGTVTGTNLYDEYGRPTSPAFGRFQYTGQVWIASVGMYYYRARFYHPGLGRFMQTDPIGYGAGMNMYAYVGNDPVNDTDPSGLDPAGNEESPPPKCMGDQCPTGNSGQASACSMCSWYLGSTYGPTLTVTVKTTRWTLVYDSGRFAGYKYVSSLVTTPGFGLQGWSGSSFGLGGGMGGPFEAASDGGDSQQQCGAPDVRDSDYYGGRAPSGRTIGGEPIVERGRRIITNFNGADWNDMVGAFWQVTRRAGDISYGVATHRLDDFERLGSFIQGLPSGITLRIGRDRGLRIDIPRNTFDATKMESIHPGRC